MLLFLWQPYRGPRRSIQHAAARSCHIWGLPGNGNVNIFLLSERILNVKFGVTYNSTVGGSRNVVLVVLKQVLYLTIQDLSHEESKMVTFSERKIEGGRKEETNIN